MDNIRHIGGEESAFRMVARAQEEAHVVRGCPPTPKRGSKQKWDPAAGEWVFVAKRICEGDTPEARRKQSRLDYHATIAQLLPKDENPLLENIEQTFQQHVNTTI